MRALEKMDPKVLLLTGADVGGKSSIEKAIREYLAARGWKPYFTEETATLLMREGMQIAEAISAMRWEEVWRLQHLVTKHQVTHQDILVEAARASSYSQTVVITDRGVKDNEAYLPPGLEGKVQFAEATRNTGTDPLDALERYDGGLDLVTTAIGERDIYLKALDNNPHRFKRTPEQAAALEARTQEAAASFDAQADGVRLLADRRGWTAERLHVPVARGAR